MAENEATGETHKRLLPCDMIRIKHSSHLAHYCDGKHELAESLAKRKTTKRISLMSIGTSTNT
jgi:hypothetical protein